MGRQTSQTTESLHDRRFYRQVRNQVAIHHVDADPLGTLAFSASATCSPRHTKSAARIEGKFDSSQLLD